MSTQVATKEKTQVTTTPTVNTEALSDTGLSMSDFRPSYISIQQKMSKAVDQGFCKPGDILETPINTVIGGEGKPVELFPIFQRKEWCSFYKDSKDLKPFRKEAFGPTNAHWKYNEVVDGREIKNDLVIVWYMLPVTEGALPCIVTFRGNSGKAGNNINQMVTRLVAAKKPSFSKAIKLESVKDSNDKGTFYVFKTEYGRDASASELEVCNMWQGLFKKQPTSHDEEQVPF